MVLAVKKIQFDAVGYLVETVPDASPTGIAIGK
jgi:hypothetical protein